ncbi:MAG: radical SAM family heme chaperone HemW [Bacteroidales bacterium]|nr:radical SAM family heme chaperone HemW [Bacteroidales bacterium]
MAGIYIHIPFCKTRCVYCDFYSTTQIDHFLPLIEAEQIELIEQSSQYSEPIDTIYFGGGTPSFLPTAYIETLLNTIVKYYNLSDKAEITLEANPDDLYIEKIKNYKTIGINRLSIGIQSFHDDILQFLSRRHTAKKAIDSVKWAQKIGFDNISIDLMYGISGLTSEIWDKTLDNAVKLGVQHISAYHLTFEKGTPLYQKHKNKEISTISEDESVNQYQLLIEKMAQYNFIHYEVSNFALAGFESKHNAAYWHQKKYIGIGPSAHSYTGTTRRWNISSLFDYIHKIKTHSNAYEEEVLTTVNKFNEYLLTHLRLNTGADFNELSIIDKNIFEKWHLKYQAVLKTGLISEKPNGFFINENNWLLLDYILTQLWVDV